MFTTISSDLQSQLQAISSLVHEDGRVEQSKSAEIEEIGQTILKKIYAESSDLPTSARVYLEEIASSIIDKNWSDIPKPDKIKIDIQKLNSTVETLSAAILNTAIDIVELFRVLMEYKGNQAYSLSQISIMDSKSALELADAQFKQQAEANLMQFGADVAAAATQILMGAAQLGSSLKSAKNNKDLFSKTKDNLAGELSVSKNKQSRADLIASRDDYKTQLKKIENDINFEKNKKPIDVGTLANLEKTKGILETKIMQADKMLNYSENDFNRLVLDQQQMTAAISSKTDLARYKDQIRGSVIQSIKGLLDVGVSGVRLLANTEKLEADRLGAAKDMAERSSAAMKEASRNATEDLKKILGYLETIQQALASTMSVALRA